MAGPGVERFWIRKQVRNMTKTKVNGTNIILLLLMIKMEGRECALVVRVKQSFQTGPCIWVAILAL